MRFRPRARRKKNRKDRPIPTTTRRERIAQEGSLPPGHGRNPARQSQPGEGSCAAKPRTQACPSPRKRRRHISGRPDDTGNPNLYDKGRSEKNAAAPNGAAANPSVAIRSDALQSLAGVAGGFCFAPKLPRMVFKLALLPRLPAAVPTVQLPAISRSFASARGP